MSNLELIKIIVQRLELLFLAASKLEEEYGINDRVLSQNISDLLDNIKELV